MNASEAVSFVQNFIKEHRAEVGQRPKTTPVTWKGIKMTVKEAKHVIEEFEALKLKAQTSMNNTQTGGEITKLAVNGAGLAATITGIGLMLFPPTAVAGIAVLASGIGASGLGSTIGDGIRDIGTNNGMQEIAQIDAYIESIKNALIDSIEE